MEEQMWLVTFVLWILLFSICKAREDMQIILEEKPDICDIFATNGDTVNVHYTGLLKDGRIFDSSLRDGRGPFKFLLGTGNVIKGWERGVHGMCPGEKRKLIVPPHLAYGSNGVDGLIPPHSTIIFQVQLISLNRQSSFHQLAIFLNFAVWPISILSILYYLYRKINMAVEKDRKSDKRTGKKKK